MRNDGWAIDLDAIRSAAEKSAWKTKRAMVCVPLLFRAVGWMPSFSASVWHGYPLFLWT